MHPNIELSLADAHPEVALHMLREGTVDAAIIFRYDAAIPEGVRVTRLFDDPTYLLSLDPARPCSTTATPLDRRVATAAFITALRHAAEDPRAPIIAAGGGA